MGPHGLHGLGADGPRPMGQGRWASRTPPWGYIPGPEADGAPWGYTSGPEADGAPWAPWASATPPWGCHLKETPYARGAVADNSPNRFPVGVLADKGP